METPEQQPPPMVELLAMVRQEEEVRWIEVWVGVAPLALPNAQSMHRPVVWPDPFIAREDQYVVWFSARPFTIAFHDPRPTEGPSVLESDPLSEGDISQAGHVVVAKMRPGSDSPRAYKYTLTVADPDGLRLRTVDPGGHVERDPKKIGG